MIPCSLLIRISLCLALLVCAGCGRSLFSVGTESAVANQPPANQPPAAAHKPSAPPPSLPSRVERKPVCYDTAVGFDKSYHNKVLTEDVTWSGRVLIKGVLTIAPQATLNISPGTEIAFVPDPDALAEGTLLVKGRIAAHGTAGNKILFKASTKETISDSWRGVIVLGSEKNNVFEHCRIEGATVGLDAIYSTISVRNTFFLSCGTGVRLQNALFQARGGGVSGSDLGYALMDGESDIRDVSFANNSCGLFVSHGSLSVKGCSFSGNTGRAIESVSSKISVSGASFAKNGTGLSLADSEGAVEGSRIVENREYGVQLIRSRIKIFGNLIFMNTGIGIQSDSGGSAAWDNNISLNGLYDFYNAGSEEFTAIANWWGGSSGSGRKKRVFDKAADPDRGSVLTMPELSSPPAQNP
jgi:hypothetical protein